MRKSVYLTGTILGSIVALGLAGPASAETSAAPAAAPTVAQDDTTTADAPPPTNDKDIVVTGSRIARPNDTSVVPITTVTHDELINTGKVSIGDIINDLPAARSTYSQSNSTRFIGTSGLNLIDLRGLGTARTLVLVNGRRHVAGDILSSGVSVDVNSLPSELIDRVDVVTGGNSAVYGSDALAGVVNFVLKRNFEGITARGQAGVSTYGDAAAYSGSITAGTNFADDRGNIAFSAEFARQNEYFAGQRPSLRSGAGFVVVDSDPAGLLNGSDGNPDRIFFSNIQSATTGNTGLVPVGGNARLNCGTDAQGAFFNCPYFFRPDGTLVPITGTRIGLGPNGAFTNSNGEDFTSGEQLQLSPNLQRYSFNALGHFTFSPAFEVFFEGKYAKSDAFGSGTRGPSFIPSATFLGDARLNPRLDNPYLSTQARTLLTQLITQSNGAAPASNARFTFRESLLNLGRRFESEKRETWRGVVGVRGTFNDDWSYEVSANYGKFIEHNDAGGVIDRQKFLFAIDAATDPSTGQITCRAKFDPAARNGFAGVNGTADPARLASDIANCVPINPFGGQYTQAQANYLLSEAHSVGKISQFVANAYLSGTTQKWFSLPGGPVGFAIGAEYRRETNDYVLDPVTQANYLFYNAIPTFSSPSFEVKEVFGELRAPIVKDVPFFHDLTATGAVRYADYKGATGSVVTWDVGGEWSPVSDLRFRGTLSHAVRAPNLGELYAAIGQNFGPAGFTDPCSLRNIGAGSTTRQANCRAAGVPAAFDYVYTSSLLIRSGGNPNLTEETSRSLTLGGVYQPHFLPGLTLSVDYFDIKVSNVIAAVGTQQIVNSCYDLPTIANPFCSVFQRAGAGGGPNGEEAGRIIEGSLLQSSVNYASLRARGIDAELGYRHSLGGDSRLDLRLQYTHNIENSQFLDPTNPAFADVQLLELGTPQDEFILHTDVKTGPLTFNYKLRYIGKQVLNTFEDVFTTQGRAPQNADFSNVPYYPEIVYNDMRMAIDANKKFQFYIGVDNIFNVSPPYGLTGTGGGSGIYDNRGRYFYSGFAAKF